MWLTASLLLAVLSFSIPALAKRRPLPDQTVTTPVGDIKITNLMCDHALGFLFLNGNIVNATTKSWDTLYLAIELQDKNGVVQPKAKPDPIILIGDPSASTGIVATAFVVGTTIKLRYQESAKADNDTLSVKFKFADGRYPVHYRTVLTKPQPTSTMEYNDDALAINFSLQKTEIDFVLQNKSDDPIKLDWNLVSFIQSWGTSQAVIHKGIKLADKQAPKAPSVVPPKAKIEDIVVPVENVEFANGEWRTQDLLLDGPASLKMVGQEFSIFMPLDLGDKTKNYTFTFKILSVD